MSKPPIKRIKFFWLALAVAAASSSFFASAFTGPGSQGPGTGVGAIGLDAANNISIGTSTTKAGTKFLVIGASAGSGDYALQAMALNQNPLLVVRDDGNVGIATSNLTNGTLNVQGTIWSSGNFLGNINASQVLSGVFAPASGNFAFQSSLGIATTTNVSLPQALSVYGGGYFSGPVSSTNAYHGGYLTVTG